VLQWRQSRLTRARCASREKSRRSTCVEISRGPTTGTGRRGFALALIKVLSQSLQCLASTGWIRTQSSLSNGQRRCGGNLRRVADSSVGLNPEGGGRESLYILDPNGGSLRVRDDGGAGGRGGTGGRAGRGVSGGMGFPPGLNGLDGHSGRDGRPGNAGAGGTITVSVDPAAQKFLSCITWSNRSGDGAPGPAPVITVEPVAPLWWHSARIASIRLARVCSATEGPLVTGRAAGARCGCSRTDPLNAGRPPSGR
jgi:hypothetical protein